MLLSRLSELNSIPGDRSHSNDDSNSDDDKLPLSNLRLSKQVKRPIIMPETDTKSFENENSPQPSRKIYKSD